MRNRKGPFRRSVRRHRQTGRRTFKGADLSGGPAGIRLPGGEANPESYGGDSFLNHDVLLGFIEFDGEAPWLGTNHRPGESDSEYFLLFLPADFQMQIHLDGCADGQLYFRDEHRACGGDVRDPEQIDFLLPGARVNGDDGGAVEFEPFIPSFPVQRSPCLSCNFFSGIRRFPETEISSRVIGPAYPMTAGQTLSGLVPDPREAPSMPIHRRSLPPPPRPEDFSPTRPFIISP